MASANIRDMDGITILLFNLNFPIEIGANNLSNMVRLQTVSIEYAYMYIAKPFIPLTVSGSKHGEK